MRDKISARLVQCAPILFVVLIAAVPTSASASATANAGSLVASALGIGAQQLASAAASLQHGAGPAGGAGLTCAIGVGSARCSSPAVPVALGPTIPATSWVQNPTPERLAYPAASIQASMAYDAYDHYVLFFGGFSTGTPSILESQTWSYAQGVWSQVPVAGPTARMASAMVYDAFDKYILLFGGCTAVVAGPLCATPDSQTWTYQAGLWTQLHIPGPPPRFDAMVAYQPSVLDSVPYVLLFGGCGGSSAASLLCPPKYLLGDTWSYLSGAWTPVATPGIPPAMAAAAMAYDPNHNYVLLAGNDVFPTGCGAPPAPSCITDTWDYTTATGWVHLGVIAPSGPRYWATMTTDTHDGNVVLFGGCEIVAAACSADGDTWLWTSAGWFTFLYNYPQYSSSSQVYSSPVGRFKAAQSDDPNDNYVVLWGGDQVVPPGGGYACVVTDTWAYDDYVWSTSPCQVEGSPTAGVGTLAMADDPVDGYVLEFGGYTSYGPPTHTGPTSLTWAFADNLWMKYPLFVTPAPTHRYGASMVWDSTDQEVVLFGGYSGTAFLGDTWTYVNNVWTSLTPGCVGPCPSARAYAAMSDDPPDKGVLLFGGSSAASSFLADTYIFTGSAGGAWTFVPPGITNPAPRMSAGMTFDGVDNEPVLFGGASVPAPLGCGVQCGDTWGFSAGAWVLLATTGPSPRSAMGLTFDAGHSTVLLYGGFANPTACAPAGYCQDTWEFTVATGWVGPLIGGAPPPVADAGFVYDTAARAAVLLEGCGQSTCPLDNSWEFT